MKIRFDKTEPAPLNIKRGVGISQVLRKRVRDRIPVENLRPCLTALGWIVNYEFDEDDWEDVSIELPNTSLAKQDWYECELVGSNCACVRLAKETDNQICIDVEVTVEVLPQVRIAIDIFTRFIVNHNQQPESKE